MCGISGFYSPNHFFSEEDLRKMNDLLSHRGPDAEGYFFEGNVGLGHRRLSIIDVSEKANQPMFSANNRYVIIFNGEIYNYKELISLLDPETRSQLKTTSDTEVILELFAKMGNTFVEHLNGMFTIAIYDKIKNALYLFRDRMGIKPLFYFYDGTNFAFASELKSLLQISRIPKKKNASSLRTFLHLGYIPAPYTAYESIQKMESGCALTITSGGIEKNYYWSLGDKLSENMITDEHKAFNELERLLIDSVSIQMRSDVPLGIFLSGGVDSSLIASIASSLNPGKLKTFSIGFSESTHDESAYAEQVARHLKTEHHPFIVSHKEAMSVVEDVLNIYDEPYADSSAIPTLLLSKLTRQQVTVALSGDGADELFHGYGSYKWAERLNQPLVKLLRIPTSVIFSMMPERFKRVSKLLSFKNAQHKKSHIFSQEQYLFSEPEINSLLHPDFAKLAGNQITDHVNNDSRTEKKFTTIKNREITEAEKQSIFDLQYYLQDELLTKIDRASMRHSLEVRVPYLDHRIVEFAINLSPSLKTKNGIQKYILKKLLYKYLPENIFDRPKQGFSVPMGSWLKNDLKYLVEENLSEKIVLEAGVVEYSVVKKYLDDFYAGRYFYSSRIWSLIVLHSWLRKNKAD